MPSNHLILCHPLLLLPSVFPSIRVFSSESVLCIRWPQYWSFSFSISPSNEYIGLISLLAGVISLQSKELSRVFSNITVQQHQFFSAQLSLWSNYHIHTTTGKTIALTRKTFVSKVIRTRSGFPHSQYLPSGSFHKPLILICHKADRMKTTITKN